jgi:D-threo-aldose 1-dehydrogenase
VGVAAAGVFNSGLLATRSPSESAPYEYGVVPPGVLIKAREIAAEFDVDLPTAALHYPLREPAVQTVVVGASTRGGEAERARPARHGAR